jgi:hypothetical protein
MHDVCNWGLVRDVQRNERASESGVTAEACAAEASMA